MGQLIYIYQVTYEVSKRNKINILFIQIHDTYIIDQYSES